MSWMDYRRATNVVLATLALGATACGASQPPPELVDARKAYERARDGAASRVAPVSLDEARLALEAAEAAFEDSASAQSTRDLAYVAERRALIAESDGNRVLAGKRREETLKEKERFDAMLRERTEDELQAARSQLALHEQRLQQSEKALEEERRAREEAEKRAAAAMESLREVAQVKEEARGMVITLSGAVLFASGQSTLLPVAKRSLDQVAETLREQSGSFVIEGHTDARGSNQLNMKLSLARAESVRSYLISQGLPADRIRAEGLGPSRPVADNATPDGRANNRRVEIVVQPSKS